MFTRGYLLPILRAVKEYMMGQLAMHGYTLVDSLDAADICVVNSCTVKNPAESRGLHLATGPKRGNCWVANITLW